MGQLLSPPLFAAHSYEPQTSHSLHSIALSPDYHCFWRAILACSSWRVAFHPCPGYSARRSQDLCHLLGPWLLVLDHVSYCCWWAHSCQCWLRVAVVQSCLGRSASCLWMCGVCGLSSHPRLAYWQLRHSHWYFSNGQQLSHCLYHVGRRGRCPWPSLGDCSPGM